MEAGDGSRMKLLLLYISAARQSVIIVFLLLAPRRRRHGASMEMPREGQVLAELPQKYGAKTVWHCVH